MKFYHVRKRFLLPFLMIFMIGYSLAILSPDVEVDHVFGFCPVYTIYTNKFINPEYEGINKGILNIIRPHNRGTTVKVHEMKHAEQAYRTCFINLFLAVLSEDYLAKYEAEAYATEINDESQIPIFANLIHELYSPTVPVKTIDGYIRNYF